MRLDNQYIKLSISGAAGYRMLPLIVIFYLDDAFSTSRARELIGPRLSWGSEWPGGE